MNYTKCIAICQGLYMGNFVAFPKNKKLLVLSNKVKKN